MFTATLKTDESNKEAFTRTVVVTFTDGKETFDRTFRFPLNIESTQIKRTVKRALDEMNTEPEEIAGDIADAPVEDTTPSREAQEAEAWLADFQDLRAVQTLEALGVTVATANQLTALQERVRKGFKREYSRLIN